jgi:ribosomal protein L14E/L6E/L27E
MQVQKGMVVRATAGKEQNGFYLVVALEDGFAFLADGKRRTLAQPKRKNIRHIALTSTIWDLDGLTDREVRRRLHEYAAKGGF